MLMILEYPRSRSNILSTTVFCAPLDPADMSRKSLEQQIRELSHELTMATFISRGAVSENRELKSEIEDLRKQNLALRTTERRLESTEDELERCQEQVLKTEERVRELELLTKELQSRLGGWEGIERDMRNWMKQGQGLLDIGMSSSVMSYQAGPSTPARSRSRQIPDDETKTRRDERRAAPTNGTLIADLFPDAEASDSRTPGRRASPAGTKKKRRRLGEEDEEEVDEPYEPPRNVSQAAPQAKSRSPLRRERKRPQIQLATIKVERPDSEGSDDGDPLDLI